MGFVVAAVPPSRPQYWTSVAVDLEIVCPAATDDLVYAAVDAALALFLDVVVDAVAQAHPDVAPVFVVPVVAAVVAVAWSS